MNTNINQEQVMPEKTVDQPDFFYDDRFLEIWVGSIISDPSAAIIQLVPITKPVPLQ
jgi:hypothetical protein